ncbi:hypothetical protein L1887_58678 [Cichorium endivia]|nr:hypothetical protein L1887_58678 [Cichorium endivia]
MPRSASTNRDGIVRSGRAMDPELIQRLWCKNRDHVCIHAAGLTPAYAESQRNYGRGGYAWSFEIVKLGIVTTLEKKCARKRVVFPAGPAEAVWWPAFAMAESGQPRLLQSDERARLKVVDVVLLGSQGVVVFDPLLEAPAHKVGVHLQAKVDEQRKDKCDVQAVESRRAEARRHGIGRPRVFALRAPQLTTIVALPYNLGLLAVELEHHEPGANRNDDQDERPHKEAEPHKHVRVIGHAHGGQNANRHDRHADTAVDLVLGIVEEEELPLLEEQDRAGKVVRGDEHVPHHRAAAQWEEQKTVVTPHDCVSTRICGGLRDADRL